MAKIKTNKITDNSAPSDMSTDPVYHLISGEGEIICPGATLHVVSGAFVGRAYRYEGITMHGHTHAVKVTRKAIHGHFRAVEWVHPSAFGCTVHRPLSYRETVVLRCHTMWTKIDDWFWAGTFALVPLAVFEHYHLATTITEVISLGYVTGGGH